MHVFENRFLRQLAERIDKAISSRLEQLADPKSKAKDHAEYLGRVEGIAALRLVAEWMTDIEKQLSAPDEEQDSPNRARRVPRQAPYGA